jgi:alpha-mannosidase/mannosylglycerate hydrolase
MMDELIEHMEQDPDYRFFHMDGQTIMLEDYLEIRPEQEERLKKLIRAGRIVIGPWYVMPDEFLLTGESLVRNLQKGFEICKAYGVEPMKSGYVTDIFGHNSQFPQILKGFDIDSAVLYRGIGDYLKDSFQWEGADGSHVLCVKLDRDRSYSNFYFAIRWPFEGRELYSRLLSVNA